ncbi:MAG: hypothetical protein A3C30_04210 [Candidatus Levybacteria bacterium RIFCSPHIGHO2_02_FULL_40_18]|nr:MAG: hypothetical protein A2869_01485 [Candidatus Levybacteria bacterium RIFCSPHIGHO2_01_FULL_40_58]OGH26285.1 MAG: hypothetical protein A3C30_04210 [Candidatus Levybacteria bacterium RIFCSPHIGHO2_02_FULL_40_18]OGH31244.1 MAG: hypothetical protein A3E43_02465 [Candidatus Levybacteria bacterium RIFCSPHIGHO2_12_FULL_40_31]OGH39814.1 MAG: hypothetical protein A2894_02990 [Candidatus Levybacteria bacterium RIFCSPLOWO2_01_FULL_40_64]OGH49258.1 MAG: hypothetical protein A3I54_01265 [Candidatus Lev
MKKQAELFLGGIVTFFAALRFPSLFEPYWYGDEGVYQVVGTAIRQGRILYSEIWDNKPPILYLIYALFNGEQFYVRLASLIVGIGTIVVFYYLAIKIFKNLYSIYFSTAFFALMFSLPVLEGNIANAENFMLLPVIGAFYYVVASSSTPIKSGSKNRFLFTFMAGVLMSFAFLTKTVAIFDMAALFIALFVLRFFEEMHLTAKNIHRHIRAIINGLEQETVLVIGFIAPIIVTILYFLFVEVLVDFLRATFSQNVGYVGYGNFFLFPMGFLYLKLFLLLFLLLLVVRYREHLGKNGILIFIWLAFSIFNAFFSQRPYTHYLLVAIAPFSLFIGYMIENKKLSMVTLPLLIVMLLLILSVFRLNFRKAIPYYENFLSFIFNNKSVEDYQAFFDKKTPRDYEISNFVKTKTNTSEGIFIWGDNPQVYKLSEKLPPGRYTVSYHITFYPDAIDETKRAIEKQKVKYIIQTKESPEIFQFLDNYELKYRIAGTNIYERKF